MHIARGALIGVIVAVALIAGFVGYLIAAPGDDERPFDTGNQAEQAPQTDEDQTPADTEEDATNQNGTDIFDNDASENTDSEADSETDTTDNPEEIPATGPR